MFVNNNGLRMRNDNLWKREFPDDVSWCQIAKLEGSPFRKNNDFHRFFSTKYSLLTSD